MLSFSFSKNTCSFFSLISAIAIILLNTIATVNAQEICARALEGGYIYADTTAFTVPFQPPAIQNIELASNTLTVEYLWLKTTDIDAVNGLNSNFDIIPNSNSSTYLPAQIVQTTWYRRLARYAGCTDYNAQTYWARITIDDNATPAILAPTQIFAGQTATLTTAGGIAYRWSNGHTTPSIDVRPAATTTYTVTITTQNGQNVTLNATIFVLRGNDVVQNVAEKEATSEARTVLNTTNPTNNTTKQVFGLSPNPNATNTLTINWTATQNNATTLRIMDMTGKTMQATLINAAAGENIHHFAIDALVSGVYFVQIVGENEQFVAQRFVKL